MGSTGRWLGFVILAGLYPFWRVCLVSFWREQTYVVISRWTILVDKNSIQMDNFVPQTDTQTHRHTDTLVIFISIETGFSAFDSYIGTYLERDFQHRGSRRNLTAENLVLSVEKNN